MNIHNFLLETEHNVNNVLCLDFDGVIHNDYLGFHDGTIYGDPIPGSLDAIKELCKKYELIIFTCKANPKRPLINNKTGTELIWDWLEKYEIKNCISDVTFCKPTALAYIDDKAFRFENWAETIKSVESL
jgi:histidinol phosphatase-like enzyme